MTLNLLTDVRLIDDATGNLQNIYTVSGVTQVIGTGGTGAFSGASGACIDWLTGQIHGKHLSTGRTFIVPTLASIYTNTGTVSGAAITILATSAEAMRTAPGPQFGVWGRPRPAPKPPATTPPALTGQWWPAISSRVPSKAVVLRSRRD